VEGLPRPDLFWILPFRFLFLANICWSLSCDAAYAFDDLNIGVISTVAWLGDKDVSAVVALGGSLFAAGFALQGLLG